MEEGRAMEDGNTNTSRAGKWIKDIFKKKEEGENDLSDENPPANGHKTVELADISEEDEEDNHETKANGNGTIPNQPEETETEMEDHDNSREAEKSEVLDSKEEDENAANALLVKAH